MSQNIKDSYEKTVRFEVESNLSDGAVVITDSKAIIIYRDFFARRVWIGLFSTFISVFVSLLITLLTSSFNMIFGLPESPFVLKGIFITLCALFGLASVVSFVFMIISIKKYNERAFIKALHNDQEGL
jgi:uncharacterized Tic20 family protein